MSFSKLGAALALALAVVAALLYQSAEPSITTLPDVSLRVYDVEPVVAPRLGGVLLVAVAKLVRLPLIGPIVVGVLKNDNGVQRVREFAAAIDDDPTEPVVTLPRPEQLELAAQANKTNVTALLGKARNNALQKITGAYAAGRTTPQNVVEATWRAIHRADASEPPLNPLVALADKEALMASARKSAARWAAGEPRGPLDGVLVAVKDEVDMQGFATAQGTSFLAARGTATVDSVCVARLRRAGALIVGKAHMHEIGIGTTGHSAHHPTPRNPFAPNAYAGGSSSGSAVAVAAGIVPVALGADGGSGWTWGRRSR